MYASMHACRGREGGGKRERGREGERETVDTRARTHTHSTPTAHACGLTRRVFNPICFNCFRYKALNTFIDDLFAFGLKVLCVPK